MRPSRVFLIRILYSRRLEMALRRMLMALRLIVSLFSWRLTCLKRMVLMGVINVISLGRVRLNETISTRVDIQNEEARAAPSARIAFTRTQIPSDRSSRGTTSSSSRFSTPNTLISCSNRYQLFNQMKKYWGSRNLSISRPSRNMRPWSHQSIKNTIRRFMKFKNFNSSSTK